LCRLDLISRRRGLGLKMENWNPCDNWEDAAMAPEYAVLDLIAGALDVQTRHQLESASAIRATKNLESGTVHDADMD
jgi:hypothetical protein